MTQNKIAALTQEYLAAMQETAASGGRLEDHMSSDGVEALRKITNRAPTDGNDGAAASITGAFVPTVTKTDENGRQSGYDLFSLLMTERIVLLNGGVDDSMAAVACASLLYLDSPASGKPGEPISVYIDSPGGSVIAGMAIIDTMETISSHITTVGIGMQASMGSHLLAAGDTRLMTENSTLMIHSIGSGTEGKLADQVLTLNFTERLFEQGKANYIRHVGLTEEFWDLVSARDTYFTADQAKKMGFIHDIIHRNEGKKPAPYEASAQKYLFNLAASREADVPKSENEILKLLLATSTKESLGERRRPELIVALSQLPKYWTPELKAEKDAAAKAAGATNDNAAGTKAKKQAAPGL